MSEAVAPRSPAPRHPPPPVPMYFGTAGTLFGIYHPPQASPARSHAIVLCYPLGHEYLRVHRSFRNLAVALSRLGFPVLRFDYAGTGDSAGDGSDTSLETAQRDLDDAIEEVRRRSGLARIAIAGLRLGATIAWVVTQSPWFAFLTFIVMGVGMAFPYVLLTARPKWLERLPRAGEGSAVVKQVMGLLLIGVAVYFLGVGFNSVRAGDSKDGVRVEEQASAIIVAPPGSPAFGPLSMEGTGFESVVRA